ncbi:hypothetical protein ABB07_34625 [Streptomyces incarnatus]|uniref:phospholipase C n=1 Tax=Streptomyces incarnatus TaxID=665007 RepID=A0ABM5TVR5_9ACTN|nr:hypothetical protein ABB07_34625 [Streptomyces incarnatus]
MTPISRRGFVGLGASAAAGAALGAGTRTTATAATTASGTIRDVRRVAILMQENRGFDHYFGRLKGVRGFDDRSGITLGGGHPVFDQPGGTARRYPWKLSATPSADGKDGETLARCNGDLLDIGTGFGGGMYDFAMVGPNRFPYRHRRRRDGGLVQRAYRSGRGASSTASRSQVSSDRTPASATTEAA